MATSRKTAQKAPRAPQTPRQWAQALSDNPDALADLLRALVAATGDVAHTAEGLHALVSPRVSFAPFPEALRQLNGPSLRELHRRCTTLSWPQLGRLARGERKPLLADLVEIADASGVPVTYFADYRRLVVVRAVEGLMAASPRADLALYRAVAGKR